MEQRIIMRNVCYGTKKSKNFKLFVNYVKRKLKLIVTN